MASDTTAKAAAIAVNCSKNATVSPQGKDWFTESTMSPKFERCFDYYTIKIGSCIVMRCVWSAVIYLTAFGQGLLYTNTI